MNKRIKKKVAKRQMIAAMRELVELAQEMERWEEECKRRYVEAFEQYYLTHANAR
ncbi:hypothetical protein [[Clostridium] symbiosum]|mgnify:FL=1|uniref:hypothetical protein n=1 Tax=Clostridium symbiosum TaxID=1512 RepID=UPI001680E3B2|nr:hypothetical protein [[Clostridium] symbiosum]